MSVFSYRIEIAVIALCIAFILGEVHGRMKGREATLKSSLTAYQTREKINHDTQNLNPSALCLALGGMPDECADLLRRLDTTTQD